MTSIINEIKSLEQYIKAIRIVYEKKKLREDLDNLLIHINNLKTWAGIDVEQNNKLIAENERKEANFKLIYGESFNL